MSRALDDIEGVGWPAAEIDRAGRRDLGRSAPPAIPSPGFACGSAHAPAAVVPAGRPAQIGPFAIGVHDDCQHRGFKSSLMRGLVGIAFGPLRLARLQAIVFADTPRAPSLYRRCGCRGDGRLARSVLRRDGFMDGLMIAPTAPDDACLGPIQ